MCQSSRVPARPLPSRVAGSLLHAIGLSELIVEDQDDYFERAVELTTDAERLGELGRKLAQNRSDAPLFDVAAYTLALEALYEKMWERYNAGFPPAAIR